jgi:hypothetical protein
MVKIGDKVKFKPAFLRVSYGKAASPNVTSVIGTVVYIDPKHRWYRVEWKPRFDRAQHECFKY